MMTEKPKSIPKLPVNSRLEREEFELACIREFSHSGMHFGASVSRAERRDRIRTAILQEQKAHQFWHGADITYAQAYALAYQETLAGSGTDGEKSAGLF
jgi:hypothetical protein